MDTVQSNIQLTAHQAQKWINKYYSCHLNYDIPVEERSENNPHFYMRDEWKKNSSLLLNFLTCPVGTEFIIEKKFRTKGPGSTKISLAASQLMFMVGFRNESMEHIYLLTTFLNAESYGWFKHKMPL